MTRSYAKVARKETKRMNGEERERLMTFILNQQVVFRREMVELKSRLDHTSKNIDGLAAFIEQQARTAKADYDRLAKRPGLSWPDVIQALRNLIDGNEATRQLANRAAQLIIDVGQPVGRRRAN